ncbi:hypothetical protein L208DRAFT_1492905 [Tricholoma matsutake]|nr:hypothetical protein L208DRAFT_1492905 [Tricholoma matsutake 945]
MAPSTLSILPCISFNYLVRICIHHPRTLIGSTVMNIGEVFSAGYKSSASRRLLSSSLDAIVDAIWEWVESRRYQWYSSPSPGVPASLGLPNSGGAVLYDNFDSLFEVSPRRDIEGTGEASKDKQEGSWRGSLQGAKHWLSVQGWTMVGSTRSQLGGWVMHIDELLHGRESFLQDVVAAAEEYNLVCSDEFNVDGWMFYPVWLHHGHGVVQPPANHHQQWQPCHHSHHPIAPLHNLTTSLSKPPITINKRYAPVL